jgi:hypothetical protein
MNAVCLLAWSYLEISELFFDDFECTGTLLAFHPFPLIKKNIGLLSCGSFQSTLRYIAIIHLDKVDFTLYHKLPWRTKA